MMIDVFYNDISLIEQGGIVQSVSPLPRPARNVTEINVPGRDGALHEFDGTLKVVQRTITVQTRNDDDRARVNAWCSPSGWLRIENEPDWAYKATQSAEFGWDDPSPHLYRAQIPFILFPYRYRLPLNYKFSINAPKAILNPFNASSEPSITIMGTGDITLYVGNQVVTITSLSETITIDSEIQEAYSGTQPMNNTMAGNFPKLFPGMNEIAWIGNVSSLAIVPRWRASL